MKEKTAFYRRFFVTLLLAALIPQGVASTTYRWVDENGNPVLSDRPPPAGTPYTEVDGSRGFGRPPQSASGASGEVRFMTEDERTAQLDIAYRARNLHCDED